MELEAGTSKSWIARVMTPRRMLGCFIVINLLNYLDRGIVPGANEQIGDFIQDNLHVNSTDVAIGGLQSAFIAGYAVASVLFGHLVHSYPPFKLMAVGLAIWCGAVVLSGAAPNFYVLVIARIFSGVGEASFQCIVPPWLDDHAPSDSRGLWLAAFFMAIPVGTAFGYGYGAVVASSASWRLAFILEAPLMAPFALLCWFLVHEKKSDMARKHGPSVEDAQVLLNPVDGDTSHLITPAVSPDGVPPRFIDEIKALLSSPVYICTVLGYASYAFVTAGFASFGPLMLKGLGLFKTEKAASLTFGGVIAVTGFVGTAVGGVVLDKLQKKDLDKIRASMSPEQFSALHEDSTELLDSKLNSAAPLSAIGITIGSVLCLFAPAASGLSDLTEARFAFFGVLGFGTMLLFATTASVNLAIMSSIEPRIRSLAIGVSTVIMHSLGDVPSPTIIGAIADKLSPEHPHEKRSASGLRETLLLLIIWLAWAVLFWGLAWFFAVRRRKRHQRLGSLKVGLLHSANGGAEHAL